MLSWRNFTCIPYFEFLILSNISYVLLNIMRPSNSFKFYLVFSFIWSRCWVKEILHASHAIRSRGSSGSIVSDYGLDDRDDRAIEVRSPTGADFSSSPCVQTGSGAHPASYPTGTGGSFPGGKARPGLDADHSPPSSAEVKNE
jgi:hypothetical protein